MATPQQVWCFPSQKFGLCFSFQEASMCNIPYKQGLRNCIKALKKKSKKRHRSIDLENCKLWWSCWNKTPQDLMLDFLTCFIKGRDILPAPDANIMPSVCMTVGPTGWHCLFEFAGFSLVEIYIQLELIHFPPVWFKVTTLLGIGPGSNFYILPRLRQHR